MNENQPGTISRKPRVTSAAPPRGEPLLGAQMVLLVAACAMAAIFAFLYITTRHSPPSAAPDTDSAAADPAASAASDTGTPPGTGTPPAPEASYPEGYEPLSLEIHHVLVAEHAGGGTEKIVAEVPALFPVGTVVWNETQQQRAAQIIDALEIIRLKNSQLREETRQLLRAWEDLVYEGQPPGVLRADSPSAP